jgi:hypothetical protein
MRYALYRLTWPKGPGFLWLVKLVAAMTCKYRNWQQRLHLGCEADSLFATQAPSHIADLPSHVQGYYLLYALDSVFQVAS